MMPLDSSARVKNILDLSLLEDQLIANSSFDIKARELIELIKAITTIDNTISFKFLKNQTGCLELALFAKRTDTIFQDLQGSGQKIKNLKIPYNSPYQQYTVYFQASYYLNVLRLFDPEKLLSVKFYDEYLVFQNAENTENFSSSYNQKLFIPIKD